jgi:hypothetical protein
MRSPWTLQLAMYVIVFTGTPLHMYVRLSSRKPGHSGSPASAHDAALNERTNKLHVPCQVGYMH